MVVELAEIIFVVQDLSSKTLKPQLKASLKLQLKASNLGETKRGTKANIV